MTSQQKSPERKFAVVSVEEAGQEPYPYVFVEDDGGVRELRPDERTYLETPFLPFDGGRPAVKESYESKNGWGSVRGFCHRNKIPADTVINKEEDPDNLLDETLPGS